MNSGVSELGRNKFSIPFLIHCNLYYWTNLLQVLETRVNNNTCVILIVNYYGFKLVKHFSSSTAKNIRLTIKYNGITHQKLSRITIEWTELKGQAPWVCFLTLIYAVWPRGKCFTCQLINLPEHIQEEYNKSLLNV